MISVSQTDKDLTGAKMGDLRGKRLLRCHLLNVEWGRVEELEVIECTGIEKNTVITCLWRNGFEKEDLFRVVLHHAFSVLRKDWPDSVSVRRGN